MHVFVLGDTLLTSLGKPRTMLIPADTYHVTGIQEGYSIVLPNYKHAVHRCWYNDDTRPCPRTAITTPCIP